MTPEELQQKTAHITQNQQPLADYWIAVIPCPPPSKLTISGWLLKFDFDTIVGGINACNRWCSKNETNPHFGLTTELATRYASGTMWKIKKGETFETFQCERTFEDDTPYPEDWDTLDNDAKRQLIAAHHRE